MKNTNLISPPASPSRLSDSKQTQAPQRHSWRARALHFATKSAACLTALCFAGLSSVSTANLLTNPGFEDGATYWSPSILRGGTGSVVTDSLVAHSGSNYFSATGAVAGWASVAQGDTRGAYSTGATAMSVNPAAYYKLSAWVKVPGAATTPQAITLRYRFEPSGNRVDVGTQTISTENWTYLESDYIPPGSSDTFMSYFEVHSLNNGVTMYVDDCAVTEYPPMHITGRVVDSLAAGVDGAVVVASSPTYSSSVTTTAGGGYYTLSVSPFADTYTVKASSPGFKGSISGVSVSSDPTAAPDIILDVDPDYHPNRLVYLKASDLSMGTNLASWPNLGLLGGTFDKFTGGTGPDVVSVLGKKAVQFLQPTSDGTARRTLASATPAPTSLSGNNPWTMHAVIYRDDASITGDNCFFKWAGLNEVTADGGTTDNGTAAIFHYRNNWVYTHKGYVGTSAPYCSGFASMPGSGAWHAVTVTFDGATESIYVDGAPDSSRAQTLDIFPGGLMLVGGATWREARGEDQYWRFNGAISSLQVYNIALTASEVAALAAVPTHTIAVDYGSNGAIAPAPVTVPGTVTVNEGDSPTFIITPALGYKILDVLVDGSSNPAAVAAGSHTFSNVTTDTHSISATFEAVPSQVVSGKVTDGTNGIMGATVSFKLSAPAFVNPLYTTTTVDAAGNYSISLPPAVWHAGAAMNGYDLSADSTFTVADAPVTVPDIVLTANPNWDVMFIAKIDGFAALANGDPTGNWIPYYPAGATLSTIATPTIATVDGKNLVHIDRDDTIGNDGYQLNGTDLSGGVVANGVSVVAVVQPTYNPIGGETRGEFVNLYYDGISFAINHNTGEIIICRKGNWNFSTGVIIPDGQKTVLSLVCQLDGSCALYVNGVASWSGTALGANYFARIEGTNPGWMTNIGVGRNTWDGWSSFNGNMGDVYVYKTAISDLDRTALESSLSTKFGIGGTPDPYTTWLALFTFAPGADTTPTGDPDGDGMNNQQEYAFGLDPTKGSSVNPISVPFDRAAGTFSYTRLATPASTGLVYSVWTSTNLGTWTKDDGATEGTATTADGVETVPVTISSALLSAPKLFVRVIAE